MFLCYCLPPSGSWDALAEGVVMAPAGLSCARTWRHPSPGRTTLCLHSFGPGSTMDECHATQTHRGPPRVHQLQWGVSWFCSGGRQRELGQELLQISFKGDSCEPPPRGQDLDLGLGRGTGSRIDYSPELKGESPTQGLFYPSSLGFKKRRLNTLTPSQCEPCCRAGFDGNVPQISPFWPVPWILVWVFNLSEHKDKGIIWA